MTKAIKPTEKNPKSNVTTQIIKETSTKMYSPF